MSFSQELRKEAAPIFEAIFQHPFVKGIGAGKLDKEQLIHYIKQDFEYLNAFMKIYGTAITKCTNRRDIAFFNSQISFILHSEIHPHHNFCEQAGVSYQELQGFPLAPTAHHYTRHMLEVAQSGTMAEMIAVLLPCPWTYTEIGARLIDEVNPDQAHPFYEWITFYGKNMDNSVTSRFCKMLDTLAVKANSEEKANMRRHFLLSCQLEYMFWDMAFKLEDWPVALKGANAI